MLDERERIVGDAGPHTLRTLFLTGAECPHACVFCDLSQYTLEGATPPGALPAQIEVGLADAPCDLDGVKLYNASNFFDARAVPVEDRPRIASQLESFERVVVENHPKRVGEACLEFARRLGGQLEIAMGLETVHPEALRASNKGMTVQDFEGAVEWLGNRGISSRAFVLVGAPHVPVSSTREWTVRSVQTAIAAGATHVSLIPVRGEVRGLEALAQQGLFTAPGLGDVEACLADALDLGARSAVVAVDTWDLERLEQCEHCGSARRLRLESANHTGVLEGAIRCEKCGGSVA